jgi:hypothetical protein
MISSARSSLPQPTEGGAESREDIWSTLTLHTGASLRSQGPAAPSAGPTASPAHLMVHLGNNVSLDGILCQDIPRLVGEVMRGAGNERHEIWRQLLSELEHKIRNLYRQAFTSSDRSLSLPPYVSLSLCLCLPLSLSVSLSLSLCLSLPLSLSLSVSLSASLSLSLSVSPFVKPLSCS